MGLLAAAGAKATVQGECILNGLIEGCIGGQNGWSGEMEIAEVSMAARDTDVCEMSRFPSQHVRFRRRPRASKG